MAREACGCQITVYEYEEGGMVYDGHDIRSRVFVEFCPDHRQPRNRAAVIYDIDRFVPRGDMSAEEWKAVKTVG